MTTQSLDSILSTAGAEDASVVGAVTEQPEAETVEPGVDDGATDDISGDPQPQPEQGMVPHAALHAEKQKVKRYTEQVASFEKQLADQAAAFDKRFNELLQSVQRQQPRPEPEQPKPVPDIFEDAGGFVNHALDPVKQEVSQLREFYSRREAIRDHGQEKVQAAYSALDEAAKAGDPDARAVVAKVRQSMDPFGDIVAWHQRTSVIKEVGTDPTAYRQRILDEALKDPTFLSKAIETARGSAAPVIGATPKTNPTALPSLNRVTAAADDADEPEDPGEVFNSALRVKRTA